MTSFDNPYNDMNDTDTTNTTSNTSNTKKKRRERRLLSRKTSSERWKILALCCILMGGNHYCCDQPASLYQQFSDHMNDSNSSAFETYFNLLYTCYSIPNIVLPLFGGGLVDQHGAWRSLILFCVCMVIGQCVFAIGVQCKSWVCMLVGRTIFGMGGESLYTAKSVLISTWFPDGQIALAFGIGMSLGRLGTVIANITSPAMANGVDLSFAIWVGFGISIIVFLASLGIGRIDCQMEQKLRKAQAHKQLSKALLEDDGLQPIMLGSSKNDDIAAPIVVTPEAAKDNLGILDAATVATSTSPLNDDDDCFGTSSNRPRLDSFSSEVSLQIEHSHSTGMVNIRDILKFSTLFWAITASSFFVYGSVFPFNFVSSGILLERDYFKDPPDTCSLRFENQCTGGTLAPAVGNPSTDENGDECPGSNDAPVLPSSLNINKNNTEWNDDWEEDEYVFDELTSDDVTCADDFWAEACTKNYCDEQDDATEKAGWIMSIPFFMGALFSAPLGHMSDIYGYRALLAMCSPILLIATHFQLAYSPEGPIFPLILQGIAFAIYCAIIWPCVALTVDIRYQGTAYGVINGIMNVGLSTYPLIVAAIYNVDGSYIPNVEIFFACSAIAGLVSGYYLNYYDATQNDGKLNKVYHSKPVAQEFAPPVDDEGHIVDVS